MTVSAASASAGGLPGGLDGGRPGGRGIDAGTTTAAFASAPDCSDGIGMALRFVADATARAAGASLQASVKRPPSLSGAGCDLVAARPGAPRAAPARRRVPDATARQSTAREDAHAAGTRKLTARITLHPRRPPVSRASVPDATGAPIRHPLPPLTEECAHQIAAHALGRPGPLSTEYLARFAEQQASRGETALTRLVAMLAAEAQSPRTAPAGASLPTAPAADAPVTGSRHVPDATLAAVREATRAWMLLAYLNDDRAGPGSSTALVDGLEPMANRVLRRLGPQTLMALHRRLSIEDEMTAPARAGMFSNRMDATVDAVGLRALRNAWAASDLCDRVGKPLGFEGVCRVLRGAMENPGADGILSMNAIRDLEALATARFQYLLVHFLRIRTAELLRAQGMAANDLASIARTEVPPADYARNVAVALRTIFPVAKAGTDPGSMQGVTVRHPSDDTVRLRLDALLDDLPDTDIRAVAGKLRLGVADAGAGMRALRETVAAHGGDAGDQAALGRQCKILCVLVADQCRKRFPEWAGVSSLDAAPSWEWDERFSRGARGQPPMPLPMRAWRAIARGARRVFFSVFQSYKEDEQRVREAYAGLVKQASRFIETVAPGITPGAGHPGDRGANVAPGRTDALRAFSESRARLMRAFERCQARCRSAGGEVARTKLQIPQDPARLLRSAFRDALATMPGPSVHALGLVLSTREGVYGLSARERQVAKPAQAPYLVACLRSAVQEEPAARAATELLRTVRDGFRTSAEDISADGYAAQAESPAEGLLMRLWALEQRFRPLDHPDSTGLSAASMDRSGFFATGLKRLSPAEREDLRGIVCDLDRPRPAALARDALWLEVVRCFQSRGRLA